MCEVGLSFGHDLLAKHGQIVDGVILYHAESVLLKAQSVALCQYIQQSARGYSYALALPSEDILHDTYLLQVLVSLIPRGK